MYSAQSIINTDRESARAAGHRQKTTVEAELRPVSGSGSSSRAVLALRDALSHWSGATTNQRPARLCGKHGRGHVPNVHRKAGARCVSAVRAQSHTDWAMTYREACVYEKEQIDERADSVLLFSFFETGRTQMS